MLDRSPTEHLDLRTVHQGKLHIDWGGGSSGKRSWVPRAEAQDKPIAELHPGEPEEPFQLLWR